MKRNYPFCMMVVAICFFNAHLLLAQVTLNPTSSSGSGYGAFNSRIFALETPDCLHDQPHITQQFDSGLDKNVFVFHSHINSDTDRCLKDDRVRMEFRGTGSASNSTTRHAENNTTYYRWKFKLASNINTGNRFFHVFQLKAIGGDDTGFPILTISPIRDRLELKHSRTGPENEQVLNSAPLDNFKGVWIEAYLKVKHGNSGSIYFTLKKVSNGDIMLAYVRENIDMWRTGAESNNPKWGIYRGKSNGLDYEQVRFADFCISESAQSQCPSSVPNSKRLEGTYTFQNKNTRNYMDSDGNGVVRVKSFTGRNDQKWRLVKSSGDYYNIDNIQSGRGMLDTDGGSRVKYNNSEPSTTSNDQEWLVENLGNNTYRFRNAVLSRFYLTRSSNSGNLQYGSGNGSRSQWILRGVNGSKLEQDKTTTALNNEREVSIYPNPTSSKFTINLKRFNSASVVSIYNLTGQLVYQNQSVTNSITLSTNNLFSPGLYMVNVTNNQEQIVQKLVIK